MDPSKLGWEGVIWIQLAQERDHWWTQRTGNIFTSWVTMPHGVRYQLQSLNNVKMRWEDILCVRNDGRGSDSFVLSICHSSERDEINHKGPLLWWPIVWSNFDLFAFWWKVILLLSCTYCGWTLCRSSSEGINLLIWPCIFVTLMKLCFTAMCCPCIKGSSFTNTCFNTFFLLTLVL
jgi:hypothetical protein